MPVKYENSTHSIDILIPIFFMEDAQAFYFLILRYVIYRQWYTQ